jgi:membrane-associated protease RseP (regulator of RpoE activity)
VPLPDRQRFRDRHWVHILLFLLTLASTTLWGVSHYASFRTPLGETTALEPGLLLGGLWYSLTILAILGAHEMGHYLACRYYRVDASLPYFLPFPLVLTGTLGAFIRIREPIPTKPMLFDIGVAGPIAGFIVALPALFLGLALSRLEPLPETFVGLSLGEPLLFQWAAGLLFGPVPDGYSIYLHPMGFAAWFGLLATALNLFPIGQLDGGHITYAALGRRSTAITLAAVGATVVLTFISLSWLIWAILLVAMLFVFGPRHPRTIDEHIPLDSVRILIALLALGILAVCFTPAPIELLELVPRR